MMRSRDLLRTSNPSRARRLEVRARRTSPPLPVASEVEVEVEGPLSCDEPRADRDEQAPPATTASALLRATPAAVPVDEDDAIADHFFSSPPPELLASTFAVGREGAHDASLDVALESPRRTAPPARRARFLRIVKTSVVACSVLCIVAVLRVVVGPGHGEAQAATRPQRIEAAAAPSAPAAASTPETVTAPVVDVKERATEASPAPPVASADPRWSEVAMAKRAALVALEAHRLDDALAAAMTATVLDATDGEAWLVLGAVHQDAGRMAEAASAYRACTTQGRVDPRGECAAMLRSFGSIR